MSRGLALCVASPPYEGIFRTTCLRALYRWRVRPKVVFCLTPYHALRKGLPARVAQGGLVYMSCEVEKSNVHTICFGVQVGIDYGISKFVPMTPFKDPGFVR
ncbi:hypothetical protein M9H77_03748 [Catharanthus roseus]|uniref:Uncharacterized protein n=1 Tax=Catharanthus roseus TaxID=4058 RepID=A0ACC0CC63_CATRO|nr:hypothetical protein M9H77_03748 [Catharanthus roseus]